MRHTGTGVKITTEIHLLCEPEEHWDHFVARVEASDYTVIRYEPEQRRVLVYKTEEVD